MYNEEVIEILQAYSYYEKGIPYCEGGYLNQPFYITEAMLLFEESINRFRCEKLNKK
jgi:hypothetical protein